MNAVRPASISHLSSKKPLGTIVHVGAGWCRELPDYIASGATKIVLVEPNPDITSHLKETEAADPRISVIEAAIAKEQGRAKLTVYNHDALSSLKNPSNLLNLYPGLQKVRSLEVDCIRLKDITNITSIDPSYANILVIDAPGAESSVIEDISPEITFEWVILHAGVNSYYEDSFGSEALASLLEGQGYYRIIHNLVDSDFSCSIMRFEKEILSAKSLRSESERLRQDLSEKVAACTDTEHKLSLLEKELSAQRLLLKERENSLSTEKEKLSQVRVYVSELEDTLEEKVAAERGIRDALFRAEIQIDLMRQMSQIETNR